MLMKESQEEHWCVDMLIGLPFYCSDIYIFEHFKKVFIFLLIGVLRVSLTSKKNCFPLLQSCNQSAYITINIYTVCTDKREINLYKTWMTAMEEVSLFLHEISFSDKYYKPRHCGKKNLS